MKKQRTVAVLAGLLMVTFSFSQTKQVNVEKSSIDWLGKKVTGQHNGNINVKEGSLELQNGNIKGGSFVVDMTSITNIDLVEEEWNKKLVDHLKSDDFFGVKKYPTAKLVITKASAFDGGIAQVTGDLTIKATTEPVTFKVKKEDGAYVATMVIDRSKYDVRYGSKSFFEGLGDKVIYDEFTLDVKLVVE